MTQVVTRANLSGSKLVRVLSDLAVANPDVQDELFAEKLGLLFDFSDALTLSSALKPHVSNASEPAILVQEKACKEFERIKSALQNSVRQSFIESEKARFKLPEIDFENLDETAKVFEPYIRFYAAHQRDIDLTSRHLRALIRDLVAETSSSMKQLVVLDSALDEILADRARKLFAGIPKLLEKRFARLVSVAKQDAGGVIANDVETPPAWLLRFHQELQAVLLAELEVRLEPALGLLEAINKEVTGSR